MQCPRCNYELGLVSHKDYSKKDNTEVKEYYCSNCRSVIIEKYKNGDLTSSEWIDFNV